MEIKQLQRLVNLVSTLIEAVEHGKFTTANLYDLFGQILSQYDHASLADFIDALALELRKDTSSLKWKGADIRKIILLFPNATGPLKAPDVKEKIREVQTPALSKILSKRK